MNLFSRKAAALSLPMPGKIQDFNRLVLQNQDESFTLAFNLLGDENQACEIVQEAFQNELKNKKTFAEPTKFRLDLLRRVIQAALRRSQILPCPEIFKSFPGGLANDEKLVCILVDCLELSYQEAALVLGKPPESIRKTLADARFTLIHGSNGKR